jgi:hypothetical protein
LLEPLVQETEVYIHIPDKGMDFIYSIRRGQEVVESGVVRPIDLPTPEPFVAICQYPVAPSGGPLMICGAGSIPTPLRRSTRFFSDTLDLSTAAIPACFYRELQRKNRSVISYRA